MMSLEDSEIETTIFCCTKTPFHVQGLMELTGGPATVPKKISTDCWITDSRHSYNKPVQVSCVNIWCKFMQVLVWTCTEHARIVLGAGNLYKNNLHRKHVRHANSLSKLTTSFLRLRLGRALVVSNIKTVQSLT